jgi:hypothetical protein
MQPAFAVIAVLLISVFSACGHANAPASAITRSASAKGLAPDGFPTGQESAEGVACDLARAFITVDSELFRKVCYAITPGTPDRDAYNNFLDDMVLNMDKLRPMSQEQRLRAGMNGGPKAIANVFKARNLSKDGPASFGFAAMRMTEVQFVDVSTPTWDGRNYTNRTLVVQDEGSKLWYAIPRPDLFPLLSVGLNEESDSTQLWKPPTP